MRALLLSLSISILAGFANAGVNRWTLLGPDTATGDDSYWISLVADPSDRDTAYIVTVVGVFRTTDGGTSWELASRDLPRGYPAALVAVDANETTKLYATVNGTVYVSRDAGDHWVPTTQPPSRVTSLAFDSHDDRLYAGAIGGGIFVSGDGGKSWATSAQSAPIAVSSIAVDPEGIVYVAGRSGYGASRVLTSVDGGYTWRVDDRAPYGVSQVVVDARTGSAFALVNCRPWGCDSRQPESSAPGVYGSVDGGPWKHLPSLDGIAEIASVGGILYAATTAGGVYAFDVDNAAVWTSLGLSDARRIAVSPAGAYPHRLYVLRSSSGLTTKLEDATEWSRANEGLPHTPTYSIDVAPDASIVYAATSETLYRTKNGGDDWTKVEKLRYGTVRIDPSSSQIAYTSGVKSEAGFFEPTLEKTTDGGETWSRVTPRFSGTNLLGVGASDPKTLYAAVSDQLARSTDGGLTWQPIMNGIVRDDFDFYYGFGALSIAIDAQDARHVYLGKFGALYATDNGGDYWFTSNIEWIPQAIAFDDRDRWTLYVGTRNGVFLTTDDGITWSPAGLTGQSVSSVISRGSVLYAATDDGHVYKTADRGAHWSDFDDGLTAAQIFEMRADPNGKHLYLATAGGVYGYDIREYGPWSQPVNLGPVINSAVDDMHPALSKDGMTMFFSSTRKGGSGLDLWVTHRDSRDSAWNAPQIVDALNSSADDHAPSLSSDGHWMFFYSTRAGGCNGGLRTELWAAHRRNPHDNFAWDAPINLGCTINAPGVDAGAPTLWEDESTGTSYLYFAYNVTPANSNGFDIYVSTCAAGVGACIHDNLWTKPVPVPEINSAVRDTRTAIAHDGLQMFITSNRSGSLDLWVSTRTSKDSPWSTPINLNAANQARCSELRVDPCPAINTAATDGAAALSWDGDMLIFYSNRGGGLGLNDLYVTTREKIKE